jgi:hypothetical protein
MSMADVTLHLTLKQPHVFEKIHGDCGITEEVHEKQPVRSTVFSRHPTSE